jgi:WD40 repeat protein
VWSVVQSWPLLAWWIGARARQVKRLVHWGVGHLRCMSQHSQAMHIERRCPFGCAPHSFLAEGRKEGGWFFTFVGPLPSYDVAAFQGRDSCLSRSRTRPVSNQARAMPPGRVLIESRTMISPRAHRMAALAEASPEIVPGFVFSGHEARVWCVTSHEEGPGSLRLVSASDDGYVCIWGGGTSRRLNHEGQVFGVKVFQDPEGLWLIASTGRLGLIKVSRHGAVCWLRLRNPNGMSLCQTLWPELTQADRCWLHQMWDFSSGALLYSVYVGTEGGGSFSILPYVTDDGSIRILVGSNDRPYEVRVVDHAERRVVARFPKRQGETITHIFELSLPDKPVFVTTGNDGSIKRWDRSDYSLLDTFVVERNLAIRGAVPYVHPDGRQMITFGDDRGRIALYDLVGKACMQSIESGDASVLSLDTYTTAEGGEDRLVAGTRCGGVWLYTLPDLVFIRSLVEVGRVVRGLHVFDSPSDRRCLVAAASEDGKVTIADTGDYRAPRAAGPGQSTLRSAVKTG